ncbi:MAG: N-acetyltransferase family protein [Mycobacteriales bacterium]
MRLTWYDGTPAQQDALVPLVQAVAATGGAVGWLAVPGPEEVRAWARDLHASGAHLVLAEEDGRVLACGAWHRLRPPVLQTMAEVRKVMTHPDARGRGAGRAVVQALVAAARAAGVELLTLECRGNNHGAQRLYASLGFEVTGRRPDVIAVGDERFDQVLMHCDLRRDPAGAAARPGLVRHGSRREGPGAT